MTSALLIKQFHVHFNGKLIFFLSIFALLLPLNKAVQESARNTMHTYIPLLFQLCKPFNVRVFPIWEVWLKRMVLNVFIYMLNHLLYLKKGKWDKNDVIELKNKKKTIAPLMERITVRRRQEVQNRKRTRGKKRDKFYWCFIDLSQRMDGEKDDRRWD